MTHKDFLFQILDLFEKNNIQACLIAGTLLGAIREQNFLINDTKDTDIAIHEKDFIQLRQILDQEVLNKKFKYYAMWRKEIAIIDLENKYKVDIFFFEERNEYTYAYSAKPFDGKTGRYDTEWRMKFNTQDIFPFQTYNFLNKTVLIPNNAINYLKTQYGIGWTIPNDKWISYNPYNYDKTYSEFRPSQITGDYIVLHSPEDTQDITVICTTFRRDECVKRLLTSIQIQYPHLKTLVGYQEDCHIDTTFFNTEIIRLPDDCGLSYARNALVERVTTPYILLLDDDNWIHKSTDLVQMKKLFNCDKNIGIIGTHSIGDKLPSYEKIYIPTPETLIGIEWERFHQAKLINYYTIDNIKYGYTDICLNAFLAKTEVLKQYKWDNRMIMGEHMDFFLNLKFNSPYKAVFTPDILIGHTPVPYYTEADKELKKRQWYYLITEKYGFTYGYSTGETTYLYYPTFERKPFNV